MFLANIFRGQGGFHISIFALQRKHEETVLSGTEYTFPGLFETELMRF
jgi:hypothetical protein